MRFCIINPYYDSAPETLIDVSGKYRHVTALASALARRGHRVAVIQAFREDKIEEQNSVSLLYARAPYRSVRRLSGGPMGLDLLFRNNLRRLTEALNTFDAEAVHLNGLTLLQPLLTISSWCKRSGRPFTVSYHGGAPRRAPWLRPIQHQMLQQCRAAFFPAAMQADAWVRAGLLRRDQVVECMEVSSELTPSDRQSARVRTGMKGSPVFAWNARFHQVKDPLTALRAFGLIRSRWTDARLYMIYLSAEMLVEIEAFIDADPVLRGSVTLLGFIAPPQVQDFLNSADFLLQTSLSEVGSFSVLEAMSCGVIPAVTDIPLFRRLTNNGQCGILFPLGNYELAAEKILQLDASDISRLSRDVRSYFMQSFSYDAIARTYEAFS